jgi:hypothetical protein
MILFSHRPKLGVSVAVTSVNGELRLAIATTNNRLDTFSRDRARRILKGRLNTTPDFVFNSGVDAQGFMQAFKSWFKPTPDESDEVFPRKISKRRGKIREMILNKVKEIVASQVPF